MDLFSYPERWSKEVEINSVSSQRKEESLRVTFDEFPAGIYLIKVNNKNFRTKCKICSKITKKTAERCIVLVSLLSTLIIFHTLF